MKGGFKVVTSLYSLQIIPAAPGDEHPECLFNRQREGGGLSSCSHTCRDGQHIHTRRRAALRRLRLRCPGTTSTGAKQN